MVLKESGNLKQPRVQILVSKYCSLLKEPELLGDVSDSKSVAGGEQGFLIISLCQTARKPRCGKKTCGSAGRNFFYQPNVGQFEHQKNNDDDGL